MNLRQRFYQEYLKSAHWKQLRETVLSRDKYRCRYCGKGGQLEPHHLMYRPRFEDSIPDELITLCRGCHKKEHGIVRTFRPVQNKAKTTKRFSRKQRRAHTAKKRKLGWSF